jgi:hypothetical protein
MQPTANPHQARHLDSSAALAPPHPRHSRHRSVRLAERRTARRTPLPAPDRPCPVAGGPSRGDLRACGSLAGQLLGAKRDGWHAAQTAAAGEPPPRRCPPGSKQEPGALPVVHPAQHGRPRPAGAGPGAPAAGQVGRGVQHERLGRVEHRCHQRPDRPQHSMPCHVDTIRGHHARSIVTKALTLPAKVPLLRTRSGLMSVMFLRVAA